MDEHVLALVSDLMMSSRIVASARAVGVPLRILRSAEALDSMAGDLLLVDLNMPGATASAGRWGSIPGRRVVGFVSHTDTEAIEAARQAGIHKVLARSAFVARLDEILRSSGGNRGTDY
jgi:DNA-binding NarL/FixJ family response regulator